MAATPNKHDQATTTRGFQLTIEEASGRRAGDLSPAHLQDLDAHASREAIHLVAGPTSIGNRGHTMRRTDCAGGFLLAASSPCSASFVPAHREHPGARARRRLGRFESALDGAVDAGYCDGMSGRQRVAEPRAASISTTNVPPPGVHGQSDRVFIGVTTTSPFPLLFPLRNQTDLHARS